MAIPGKPVAHNDGLRWLYYELLWGIVAYYFRLLGVPGSIIYLEYVPQCDIQNEDPTGSRVGRLVVPLRRVPPI